MNTETKKAPERIAIEESYGIRCVFFAANFVFVLYEVKNDLNHLH